MNLDELLCDNNPVPDAITHYATNLNRFIHVIVDHRNDEIKQMLVTDFEQLFARSRTLPRCYETIMSLIQCSENMFDLQSRLVNTLHVPHPVSDSVSNGSEESQLQTPENHLRRSKRKRKPNPKYVEITRPPPMRKQAKLKRVHAYSRNEDFLLIKLFLQLGANWSTIKEKMGSERSTDSLRDRWARLQDWVLDLGKRIFYRIECLFIPIKGSATSR